MIAQFGPANLERILTVHTWYLDAAFYRVHAVTRPVTLGDDFSEWERLLKHALRDVLDTTIETDFVIALPSPDEYSSAHAILHQRLWRHERANLLTVHDHAEQGYRSRTTAIILAGYIPLHGMKGRRSVTFILFDAIMETHSWFLFTVLHLRAGMTMKMAQSTVQHLRQCISSKSEGGSFEDMSHTSGA